MDDVLDETLYHDDFLNRTLNTSTLYEKSNLDLSFLSNDHIDPKHEAHHGDPKTPDSPDLDFLRFGSPDLEQMFLNIDVNEDTDVTNEDAEDVASAAFNIEEDLVSAENCFTEALQHLHDKNETLPVDLLDITFRDDVDDESSVELSAESKLCKSSPTPSPQGCEVMKQCVNINNNNIIINNNTNSHNIISNNNNSNNHNIVNNSNNNNNNNNNDNNDDNNNNNMTNNNNITTVIPSNQLHMKQHGPSMSEIHAQQMYHSDALNNNHPIPPAKALHHQDRTNLMSGPPHHHQQNMAPIATTDITTVIPDQMALNNQIALINSMNQTMTAHQLHQQQQELAFLTQAMNFQAERETMQPHITMNSGYPQHMNHIPPHIQHKLIEQQLIHQQLSGGFHGSENNPQLSNLGQHIDAIGIDEHTLKMFVENPHLAPMNMDIQELIKRERKKLRNRIASSKCRKRKLEREGRLEDKVKTLKEKNIELNAVANALKQQICDLKQRVMDHVGEGCQIVLPS